MTDLERDIYEFLRNGDECMVRPEDWPEPLDAELGPEEHKWIAHNLTRWLKKHYRIKKNGLR